MFVALFADSDIDEVKRITSALQNDQTESEEIVGFQGTGSKEKSKNDS